MFLLVLEQNFIYSFLLVIFILIIILRVDFQNKNIFKALKDAVAESTKDEKKDSYAFVRSATINILAGAICAVAFFNLTIYLYERDLNNIKEKDMQQKIMIKYSDEHHKFILKDITDKIKKEKKEYENNLNDLNKSVTLVFVSIFFVIAYFFATMNDKSLTFFEIVKDTASEFLICSLAYAFLLAILFTDSNSYISATIISGVSLLLIGVIKKKKKKVIS